MGIKESVFSELKDRMEKTIDSLKKDFTRIRTGRATPALLDGITADYYGTPMPINQIANITVPEARLMFIQPWEKTMLSVIEKAILASDLGLNPQNDGNLLRLPIPALNEDRRKELFKQCKKMSEESKIALRNIRRDCNERIKKALKDKQITQDEEKKYLEEIQKSTDKYIILVDDQLGIKEKEIMEV